MHTCLWYQRIMVKRVERALQLLDHDTEYSNMGFECTARVLVLHRNFPSVPTYFQREVMSMEGHGIPWWEPLLRVCVKVLPWVIDGAGGLGAGKTSGAGTRGVSLDVVIGGRIGYSNTNGGESSDNRSKVHADCYPAENPSL